MNLSSLIIDHPVASGLTVAITIVVLGLLVYGLHDLLQFRQRRVWAIGGVVFRENIRRKILWLTPLVMLAIVVVTGLQQADDELDAIRQTVQFSMFASGLLVVITGVMLSCTNLPRDIESKVIFTLVTKPVTRLEIVLGKIIGFARVTGSILILMGLFTWGYIHVRSWQLHRGITAELASPDIDAFKRGRLEHHQREGLLDTRDLGRPATLDMLAAEPVAGDPVRWASTNQTFVVPFQTTREQLVPQGVLPEQGQTEVEPGATGLRLTLNLRARQIARVERPELAVHAPMLPNPDAPSIFGDAEFAVSIVAFDEFGNANEVIPASATNPNTKPFSLKPNENGASTTVTLDNRVAGSIPNIRSRWGVAITPLNSNYLLGMKPGDLVAVVPGATPPQDLTLTPDAGPDGKQPTLLSLGGSGRTGRLLEGAREGYTAVAIAHFDGPEPRASNGSVTLELMLDVERDSEEENADTTQVQVEVVNANGQRSQPAFVTPEQRKTAYAEFPAEFFAGGKYDVQLRTATRGHSVSMGNGSIAIVQSRHSFGINLGKALLSQWMLSVLVVTIGMCCSTFLSWPIAIVLCVVVLMGRWAVNQVSDSLQPGIGAMLATDMNANDPTQARVIAVTFDNLARALNFISKFLPDIDAFSVVDPLQRGLLIPLGSVGSAALVLLLFGLPLMTLSYVVLRNEEVAP